MNHKLGLGSLLMIILGVAVVVPVLDSYAINDSFCSFTGGNSTDYQKCIKSYIDYQKMNHDTDAAMKQQIEQIRNDTRHNDLEQNQTALENWVTSKPSLANYMAYGDLEQRSWYNTYMHEQLSQMQTSLKLYKQYDHNPQPVPDTCQRWKECDTTANPYTGSNYAVGQINNTKPIPLKPEMFLHPTGFINFTGIHTWKQFQDYITNSTRLNK